MRLRLLSFLVLLTVSASAQTPAVDKFRQLEEILPTPNEYRTASGAPARSYWQQRADYKIRVQLDDSKQKITGSETITYYNNSPDTLTYLWLQLDQNIFTKNSISSRGDEAPSFDKLKYETLERLMLERDSATGYNISKVSLESGTPLKYRIVETMMRIDLPEPLPSGGRFVFSVDWDYLVNDAKRIGGRTGFEYFPKDKNYLYEIAHWFPRLAAYTDNNGWQHKQFLGNGEFTLEFGDYDVSITVPSDHIVASTGVLQNPDEVLSATQRQRLEQARSATKPVFIVNEQEATRNESSKVTTTKTWRFTAANVRDFAFASSRKFIWDAQLHDVEGNRVLAMSFYPKEGEPLWSRYSTAAIIHTLNVYSRYTFAYPYPVAISVNGPVGGMEYPMICFNGPRPEEDKTYSARSKYGLISVVIHEVGHNYFPMIVNSDEREWTWMDEGLNTFLQSLAEAEWEKDYPSRRGQANRIVEYMLSSGQVPIMTSSDSLLQFGNNSYAKPAAAFSILRETILGRELFDFSFKEYARRWKFKRPQPADFFRTMEDASSVDLDWFWRGWFYTTDHTDISIENLRLFNVDTLDPDKEKAEQRKIREEKRTTVTRERDAALSKRVDEDPALRDFYNDYDELNATAKEREEYAKLIGKLTPEERELLKTRLNLYVVDLRNIGGLVMPVIMDVEYADGSREEMRLPAEIWRFDSQKVSRLILTEKEIRSIALDPKFETADTDLSNNSFPRKPVKSRFQLFKEEKKDNPMQELEKKRGSTSKDKP